MNTEIEIPKLYRTETLEINGNKVEIKGYRGNDYIQARVLERQMIKINTLSMKLAKLSNDRMKESKAQGSEEKEIKETEDDEEEIKINWEDKDIEDLSTLNEQMLDIQNDVTDIICKLGQRGLKRFYFKTNSAVIKYFRKEYSEFIENEEELNNEINEIMEKIKTERPGTTAWIDKIPDLEVDDSDIKNVHSAMARLSNIPGKKAKKEEKPDKKTGKGRQPSKKTSKTSAN